MTRSFLFMSNVRCGSTHLITSLGELPGVHADCEVKWQMPQLATDTHLHLDPDRPDFLESLAALGAGAPLIGSKFILHPQNPLQQDDLVLLQKAARRAQENGLTFIHLTRNYFDICMSTLLRGNWNALNRKNKTGSDASAFVRVIGPHNKTMLEKNPEAEKGKAGDTLNFDTMLTMLLRLLVNDLFYQQVLSGLPGTLHHSYERLETDLPDLCRRLGVSGADLAHLDAALGDPVIRKLAPLDTGAVPDVEAFRVLCAYADYLRVQGGRGRAPLEVVFSSWHRKPRSKVRPKVADPVFRHLIKELARRSPDQAR
ncbi:hypothetical protein [Alterinioella nitratireducens]|uniref:hypothetical protein n=1 Tax=Alterinioella nitratireducens TaxID=2735915 RepID=UPI0015565980|nr:hypothetical protein [Alterinioella nitratireducens]NPD21286.1 hypothetical protein [Alterinioella nitratireducens]